MEYCAGGDLSAYLAKRTRVPEETARGLMRQLAAGLKELWSHHLVHVRPCLQSSSALSAVLQTRERAGSLVQLSWL